MKRYSVLEPEIAGASPPQGGQVGATPESTAQIVSQASNIGSRRTDNADGYHWRFEPQHFELVDLDLDRRDLDGTVLTSQPGVRLANVSVRFQVSARRVFWSRWQKANKQ